MQPLPIDPLLPEVCRTLDRTKSIVLEAPPGAGKTTRVPRALLDHGAHGAHGEQGEILVLEPRRLAARLSARRVAEELGEELGGSVGYTVRFEDASSARTRIRFVTEGILTRRLLADPSLRGVGTVVLDEFHERHLAGDVALALLRRLQRTTRPELRLVVMSATLEATPIADWLGAPVLRAEGRRFDVAVEHLERTEDRRLESLVASAVRRLVGEGLDGDVLVFLPGAAEIRRAGEACASIAKEHDLLLLPLHGSLSPAEQDRAVRPADRRKIILATNVAETSVTIDGVVAVVDSGLARVASYAPWSGLPRLEVAKIARASATQRAGRAGRTRPGLCLRLYTRGDFLARPEHDAPEIARLDLAETALELFAAGVTDLADFGWFEAPPAPALAAAERLLRRLGAVDEARRVTEDGRRMLRFPLHPRLGRMLVEAERRGVGIDGCALAAIASERDVRATGASDGSARLRRDARGRSDLLLRLEELDDAQASPHRARALGLDPARVAIASRVRAQLERLVDRRAAKPPGSPDAHETALLIAVLAGYPDRVGRVRRPANATGRAGIEVVFAAGGSASLSPESVVTDADLVVAVDVEERTEGRSSKAVVRMASAVEPDWLLELFTDVVSDGTEALWNASAERVELVRRLAYEGLVLEESRSNKPDPKLAGPVLAEAARARGLGAFTDEAALAAFFARVAFTRAHCPELALPALDEATVTAALSELCHGATSFAELRQADLGVAVRARLSPSEQRALDEAAPERVTLPGGRKARVTYAAGVAPSLASRLQDFFGMADGPRVAKGRVPVVLHLLAPNQRAVQVTTDLAGFWTKHYPAIARELRRRYPRHPWPDDPRNATPPPAGPRRR